MTMICCTLTGVDQHTSPARLGQLAHKFPKAEFGILFSPERWASRRFPDVFGVQSMLDAGQLQWAIYLCGRAVPEIHSGSGFPECRKEIARTLGSLRIRPYRGFN